MSLLVLAASACFFALAGTASATTITTTHITSPADHTYLEINDDANGGKGSTITVQGTTDSTAASTDTVDLYCYYERNGTQRADKVTDGPSGGWTLNSDSSFTISTSLAGAQGQACELRAIPHGDAPLTTSSTDTGPRLAISDFTLEPTSSTYRVQGGPNGGDQIDYVFDGPQFSGYQGDDSAGSCGPFTQLYGPGLNHLQPSGASYPLSCGAELYGRQDSRHPRSSIVVDGHTAYDVDSAASLWTRTGPPGTFDGSVDNPGFQGLTVTHTFDPATGNVRIDDREPIVRCASTDAYQPGPTQCPSFVSAGIELDRVTTQGSDGRVANVSETFSSTDGAAHSIDIVEANSVSYSNGGWKGPGDSSYSTRADGASAPATAGPGTWYYDDNPSSPTAFGAITFSGDYSSATFDRFFVGGNTLLLDFQRMVPAGGNTTFILTFSQGLSESEVQGYAHAAEALYRPPSISISSPANNSAASSSPVTVSGNVTVNGAPLRSVSVNGVPATVGPGGSWTAQVPLTLGPNTITAVATSVYGATRSAQETVNFALPPGPPATAGAALSLQGVIRAILGGARFTLSCSNATCHGFAVLTTTELVRGKKVMGVSAAKRKRVRRRTVVVGRVSFSIAAGKVQTIGVTLNNTGRKLLARYKRLPAKLTITLTSPNGKPLVIKTSKLTIKPAKKHKKKHHRR